MIRQQDVTTFGRGILMGAADIVPGISGGTVALVLGIYARLVNAISRFGLEPLMQLRQRRFADAAKTVELRFLMALGAGIVTSILLLSTAITFLMENYRQHTFAAFFGLILGSSVLVAQLVPRWTVMRGIGAVVALVGAYIFVGLPPLQHPPQFHPGYLFLCGFFAICAMILPGVSGSFLLLVLGAYSQVLELIRRLKHLAIDLNDFLCLACFGIGMAAGLLSFTKVLRWLLARHESTMLALLTGLMLGSLRKLWPFQRDLTPELPLDKKTLVAVWPDLDAGDTWISLGLVVGGILLVIGLEALAAGRMVKEHAPAESRAA